MLYFIAAYNNLIPTANEGNYQALKRKYLGQLAREAPPFLAYIEMYDFSRGMCSGSLVSPQYVLTYSIQKMEYHSI